MRDRAKIQEIICRVYRKILQREPDPGGMETWKKELLRPGRNEDWLIEQIFASEEYRQLIGQGAIGGVFVGGQGGQSPSLPDPFQVSVSVIMPTWNRKHLIGRAIESILAQTFLAWELIIVDDGSEDGTRAFIEENFNDVRIRYYEREHLGVSQSRNFGISQSRGVTLAYLDSDDEWYPEFLSVMLGALSRQKVVAIYCKMLVWVLDENRQEICHKRWMAGWAPFDLALCRKGNYIGLPSLVHRKSVLSAVGGYAFDEALDRVVDWDLILRLGREVKIGWVDRVLVVAESTLEGKSSITASRSFEHNRAIMESKGRFCDR